jgi:hypothetical protein
MSAVDNETPDTPATPPGKSAPSFKAQFQAFSKFGDTKSDGRQITLSQSDKWMKQAKVVDGKKITTTDTGIYFKKLKYVTPPSILVDVYRLFSITYCLYFQSRGKSNHVSEKIERTVYIFKNVLSVFSESRKKLSRL